MGFEDAFAGFMHQTVTLAPWTGQDVYGAATYGAAVEHKARVVGKTRMVRAMDGREVVSTATVYLAGPVAVNPKDRLTLPNGNTVPILSLGQFPDEETDHHTVIYTVGSNMAGIQ